MNIKTKVHHITYSEVLYNCWYYRVYPDGSVCEWKCCDFSDDGYWHDMSPVDDGYDEVKKAGLDALKRAGFCGTILPCKTTKWS